MKKFEFDIVKFDNEDVIATSGAGGGPVGEHALNDHFQYENNNGYQYMGYEWKYDDASGTWSSEFKQYVIDYFAEAPSVLNSWYYHDDDNGYVLCPDADHSHIHE